MVVAYFLVHPVCVAKLFLSVFPTRPSSCRSKGKYDNDVVNV